MKYIRTKDGIVYENALQMIDKNWQVKAKSGRYIKVSNNLIVKPADTIEELCEKWCYDNNTGEKNVVKDIGFASFETMKRRFTNGLIKNVHLAIWTDKGLIYVARMNEKGELELL